jgi:hypothetical protein
MRMAEKFDVFVSYNSRDRVAACEVEVQLRAAGLAVWLDEWELRPEMPWASLESRAGQATRSRAAHPLHIRVNFRQPANRLSPCQPLTRLSSTTR